MTCGLLRRRLEREAIERMALMVELEGWVREAQDRLDAELGAITSVGREQRSYLKKASHSQSFPKSKNEGRWLHCMSAISCFSFVAAPKQTATASD